MYKGLLWSGKSLYTGADPEGVVWGGTHTGVCGGVTVILGLFLVFVKPIF